MPIALRADFDAAMVRAAAKRSKDGPHVNGGGIVGQWGGEIPGHARRDGWGGRERSAPSWRRSERAAATARKLKQAQDGRLLGAAGSSCAGAATASWPAPGGVFCSTLAGLRRPADCLRR